MIFVLWDSEAWMMEMGSRSTPSPERRGAAGENCAGEGAATRGSNAMTRQVLLGTTGLIFVLSLASAASAQTAGPKAPFTAILDGEVNANLGIISGQRNNAHDRDLGMEQNVWMRFFFEGKADNGLTYGWYTRMLGTSSSVSVAGFTVDREAIYLRHPSWGTVELGEGTSGGKEGFPFVTADWGPVTSSRFYLGPDGGLEALFIKDPLPATILSNLSKIGADNVDIRRTNHIYYGTPVWNGFSVNASYAPDGTQRNEEQFVTSTAGVPVTISSTSTTQYQSLMDASVNYAAALGPVALRTGVNYVHGQSKNVFSATGSTQANDAINSVHTGFRANYLGFQWAVDYTYAGNSERPHIANLNPNVKMWGWSTELEYFFGPWVVGGYYWFARAPGVFAPLAAGATLGGQVFPVAQTGNGAWEMNNFELGVGYTLAPGLKLYQAAFYYSDYNTHVPVGAPGKFRNPTGQVYITGIAFAW
jgi:predicted porin